MRPWPGVLTVVSLTGLLVLVSLQTEAQQLELRPLSWLIISMALVLGALIRKAEPDGSWSLSFLLYTVLCLFHLGLYLRPALDGSKAPALGMTVYLRIWYTDAAMVRAGLVTLLALLAYGLGVGTRCWVNSRREPPVVAATVAGTDQRPAAAISDVGALALMAGVVGWWTLSLRAAGATFYLQDYLSFLSATSGSGLTVTYLMISLGVTLIAVNVRRRLSKLAAATFALFALPAFMIGLRGEVLLPLTAALAVFARDPHNRKILQKSRSPFVRLGAIAGVVILLFGISFVQQVRLSGLADYRQSGRPTEASALGAIEEMGFTLRVVVTSLEWHEDLREPYQKGQTYVAPAGRAAARVLGLPRPDASNDYRLMNVEVAQRVGPIGGSMVAEADHNFGRAGVIGVLLVVGLAAASVGLRNVGAWRNAAIGLAGLLALIHVRNSFAPLFGWATAGALLLVAGLVVSRFYRPPRDQPL